MIKKLFKKKRIDEEQFPCPRDGKLMDKKVINDVVIDICPKCKGIWLDDDEINKLIKHAQTLNIAGDKNEE